jgi:hypothetical protein
MKNYDFAVANDSIKQLFLVPVKAISSRFEDDNLLLNIDGVVQGSARSYSSYTIKKRSSG